MKLKIFLASLSALLILISGVALGSVNIPVTDIFGIIGARITGAELPETVKATSSAILWDVRLPRALLAFAAGGALSVSGAVIQSVMRNPLASSYTLGVSSGASFGACLVILYGAALPFVSFLPSNAVLPVMGFVFGLGTIFLALAVAGRLDGNMRNNTIILVGMVFSLFINAVTSLLSFMAREHIQRLYLWQMGSFSMKGWAAALILVPVSLAGTFFALKYHRELDIMTFGESQAASMGVNIKADKRILLVAAAALTGAVTSFCGVIGFIDLVAPHIVRKVFGASHKYVLPMSAVFGGAFMVACDLAARTISPPNELPVGAVTAILGAPFFALIYFSGKKNGRKKDA